MMLWIKAFHIIAMVAWFAGIFYLPRLFVYHTQVNTPQEKTLFKTMERRLYYGIMNPSALLTLLLGFWLLFDYGWSAYSKHLWMHLKLGLVLLLVIYHIYCGVLIHRFKEELNVHSTRYYRIFNEIPVIMLVGIVLLVILKRPV